MAKPKKQPAKRQSRSRKQQQPTLSQKIWENKVRLVVILLLVALPLALFMNRDGSNGGGEPQAEAHEQQESQVAQQQDENQEDKQEATEENAGADDYGYVAQPGDTYSQVARKAIQTYGINHKVNLSQAQIIYAETLLTQEAGSPLLNADQKVSLKESTVKGWVEKAQKLTDSQKKAWEAYTVGVDFNTDNVGEAS